MPRRRRWWVSRNERTPTRPPRGDRTEKARTSAAFSPTAPSAVETTAATHIAATSATRRPRHLDPAGTLPTRRRDPPRPGSTVGPRSRPWVNNRIALSLHAPSDPLPTQGGGGVARAAVRVPVAVQVTDEMQRPDAFSLFINIRLGRGGARPAWEDGRTSGRTHDARRKTPIPALEGRPPVWLSIGYCIAGRWERRRGKYS